MRYRFLTLDVFTDRIFGGNPLAVVPAAAGLDAERMQKIARELNLSETAFVFAPRDPAHTRHVRFFTPAMELPFAGHPTVGTAFALVATGEVALRDGLAAMVFEEEVGPIKVTVTGTAAGPVAAQFSAAKLPARGPEPPPVEVLARLLSIGAADILATGADAPTAWSSGVPFLFVPVKSREAVGRARLDLGAWQDTIAGYWAPHVFPFTYETESQGTQVHARMFAPAMGIQEDPATGAAATAIAGYLNARDRGADGTMRWRIEQGLEMGRPSLIEVEADRKDGALTAVRVGGPAVLVSEGTIEVP
jgi:trans-2,3-dihydro-3-hydroxyanthranilate isomerase